MGKRVNLKFYFSQPLSMQIQNTGRASPNLIKFSQKSTKTFRKLHCSKIVNSSTNFFKYFLKKPTSSGSKFIKTRKRDMVAIRKKKNLFKNSTAFLIETF